MINYIRSAKSKWIATNVIVLILLLSIQYGVHHETAIPIVFLFPALSLPLGFVGLYVGSALIALIQDGNFIPGFKYTDIIAYIMVFLFGYLQWFVIIPWFKKAWLKHKSEKKIE